MAECGGDLDCEYKTYMRYRELSIAHNDELIACGDDAVCIQKHLDKMYSIDGGLGEVSFPVGYGEFTDLQTSRTDPASSAPRPTLLLPRMNANPPSPILAAVLTKNSL